MLQEAMQRVTNKMHGKTGFLSFSLDPFLAKKIEFR